MTEKQDLRSRLVVGRRRDGRREFDEAAVQELVELCLKPGVSIARAAMDHDVNPNQLRRWISRYQRKRLGAAVRPWDLIGCIVVPTKFFSGNQSGRDVGRQTREV
ncbi:transposase, partial [Burkholderia ubonensis]|uniref:transposase n=2 Tax=Burkholderia ubonensis TaxID=101571 RepID=UPI001E6109F5